MKILLVEDQAGKRQSISHALGEVEGVTSADIEHAGDSTTARKLLARQRFDLLVLDIAIPQRADLEVDRSAGMQLLEDVLEEGSNVFRVPTHVVGITAYEDIYEAVSGRFASRLLTVLLYDPASTEWSTALQARTRHITRAMKAQDSDLYSYGIDLGIITALQSPELDAVKQLPWEWQHADTPGDHNIYWSGRAPSPFGVIEVRAAAVNRMGLAPTAVLTSKMIQTFRPRVVAMVGISAGVRGKTNVGDVIVADPTWDSGNGKWVLKGGRPEFAPAPHQIALDTSMREHFMALAGDAPTLTDIRERWRAEKPSHALAIHVGPLASVAAVMADGRTIDAIVSHQHRETLGLDMEAYALMLAAQDCVEPRPLAALVVKGVVDFADGKKDDQFRHYAAYTSAEVLRALLSRVNIRHA